MRGEARGPKLARPAQTSVRGGPEGRVGAPDRDHGVTRAPGRPGPAAPAAAAGHGRAGGRAGRAWQRRAPQGRRGRGRGGRGKGRRGSGRARGLGGRAGWAGVAAAGRGRGEGGGGGRGEGGRHARPRLLRRLRIGRYRGDHGESCAQQRSAPKRRCVTRRCSAPEGRGQRAVAHREQRAAAARRERPQACRARPAVRRAPVWAALSAAAADQPVRDPG
jgi:hypothetical protein